MHGTIISGNHPLSAKGMNQGLFFFDTETTGLIWWAGNTIFLLGYAQVTDKEVVSYNNIYYLNQAMKFLYITVF